MELPWAEPDHQWLTAYLFFDGVIYDEVADRVLRELVTPVVEACRSHVTRWHFLRYSEDGAHIRLRFFAPQAVLEETLRPRIVAAAEASDLVGGCVRMPYEPEVERYGGPWGLVLAEELFHHQSETALALMRKIKPGTSPARLGKGLLAMLVLLFVYRGERRSAAEFAERYGSSYLKTWARDAEEQERWRLAFQEGFDDQNDDFADYVELAWEALEDEGKITADLDRYRRDVKDVARRLRELFDQGRLRLGSQTPASWDACVRWIVPSYVHMMNNRLGVSIQEESYLSVLIAGTLNGSVRVEEAQGA